jgi:hypothetical protein
MPRGGTQKTSSYRNGNARFNPEAIHLIRRANALGVHQKIIGKLFYTDKNVIWRICTTNPKYRRYKDVE